MNSQIFYSISSGTLSTLIWNIFEIKSRVRPNPKLHEILTSLESDIERIGYSADVRNITHTIRR